MNAVSLPRRALLVPIHLDALIVERGGRDVVPAVADFSRLPHSYAGQDWNAEVPWLGEAIASWPFDERPLRLGAGVHLHWALPDALCRASTDANDPARTLMLRAVPDRWLVTKRWLDAGQDRVERWIVESNYLHPLDGESRPTAITYPFPSQLRADPGKRPYRYLGRKLPFSVWREGAPGQYLPEPLTALGYGHPSFAALYPNCHSVFGLHDSDEQVGSRQQLSYEVLGFYSNAAADPLSRTAREAASHLSLNELLADFDWMLEGAADGPVPSLVCQAKLEFGVPAAPPGPSDKRVELTFGNTTTEALSAHLAGTLAGGNATLLQIEEQLEAILLGARLDPLHADIAHKFREARHDQGFTPAPPAFLWTLRPARSDTAGDSRPEETASQALWPEGASDAIDRLNTTQRQYNAAWDEIRCLREQVTSDWHKYMMCAHPPVGTSEDYPDPDDVRRFIQTRGLPQLEALLAATGEIEIFTIAGVPVGSRNDIRVKQGSGADSLAARLVRQAESLHAQLVPAPLPPPPPGAHSVPFARIMPRFFLQRFVEPRFYQPTEPVVLLTGSGADVKTARRYARANNDERLRCTIIPVGEDFPSSIDLLGDRLTRDAAWERHVWSTSPWHPLQMEWTVELRPLAYLDNQKRVDRRYDPNGVRHSFTLDRNEVDLKPRSNAPALAKHRRVYSGTSLLTPHGVDPYLAALEIELGGERDAQGTLPQETRARLLDALTRLKATHSLAQALSGFNDALLMSRQTMQLPIDDPVGFPEERALAARIRRAVGDRVQRAPQPGHSFSPIRAGELRLARLRLVDTFGQTLDVDCEHAPVRSAHTLPLRPGAAVMLPPRLVQPACLQFRWLAADEETMETNAHPHSGPVCGFVIANHFDRNLFVYESGGAALGYLETEGTQVRWRSAPGRNEPVVLDRDVDDPVLLRFLRFFLANSGGYFDLFLEDLEGAQDRIEPAEAGEALLTGRPLALVRASLSLQLQGPPAIHQGWAQLLADMAGGPRHDDGFTQVNFPIRLGEQDQLGDGLAIYFVADNAGAYDGYVIPNYGAADDPKVTPADRNCDFLYQSLAAPPLIVTMLVDPRGSVHATSGVLPTKGIDIPPQHYRDALRKLELSFLAAPLLVDRTQEGELGIPVPIEPDQAWSFVAPRVDGFDPPRPIRQGSVHPPFGAPVAIQEGWLRLTRTSDREP